MNCPTCGAPNVILHKDIWECGWCGDSGFIPQRIQDAQSRKGCPDAKGDHPHSHSRTQRK